MRRILIFISVTLLATLISGQSRMRNDKTLNEILDTLARQYGYDYEMIKKYSQADSNFIRINWSDTLYLNVVNSFGSPGCFTIWTKHNQYSNSLGEVRERKGGLSYGLRTHLIEKWDTVSLRKLSTVPEGVYYCSECPYRSVYRIIINGENFRIDRFHSSSYFHY